MADYELKYRAKNGGKRSGPHTIGISNLPTLAAAQAKARDELIDMQLRDPVGISITSAMVRRLPTGNWHRV